MKHSDDYLTIRFANPVTGQLSPTPPTSSPARSCRSNCIDRHVQSVQRDIPLTSQSKVDGVTQRTTCKDAITGSAHSSERRDGHVHFFQPITRSPLFASRDSLDSQTSDRYALTVSETEMPPHIDYSELSCSALSGNDPLVLSNMRVPECSNRDREEEHRKTTRLASSPTSPMKLVSKQGQATEPHLATIAPRLRKPVTKGSRRHVNDKKEEVVQIAAAASESGDSGALCGTAPCVREASAIEPLQSSGLPIWLCVSFDHFGRDVFDTFMQDGRALFRRDTGRQERTRALSTVLFGVLKVLILINCLLVIWRVARAIVEVIELLLWPLIIIYKSLRYLMH